MAENQKQCWGCTVFHTRHSILHNCLTSEVNHDCIHTLNHLTCKPSTKRRPACSHATFALVTNQGRKCGSMVQKRNAKKRLNSTHSPPTAPRIFPSLLWCYSFAVPEYSKHHRLIAFDRYTLVGQDGFLLQGPESQQTLSRCPIRLRDAQQARMQILSCVLRRCRAMARSRTGKGILWWKAPVSQSLSNGGIRI